MGGSSEQSELRYDVFWLILYLIKVSYVSWCSVEHHGPRADYSDGAWISVFYHVTTHVPRGEVRVNDRVDAGCDGHEAVDEALGSSTCHHHARIPLSACQEVACGRSYPACVSAVQTKEAQGTLLCEIIPVVLHIPGRVCHHPYTDTSRSAMEGAQDVKIAQKACKVGCCLCVAANHPRRVAHLHQQTVSSKIPPLACTVREIICKL